MHEAQKEVRSTPFRIGAFVPVGGLLLCAAFLWSCAKSSPGSKVDLKSGLLARWPVDTNAGGVDTARLAVLTGGVSVVSGKVGQAFSFDGKTGRVVTPDAPNLRFYAGQDFSMTAWIKPERSDTAFGVMSIVEKRRVGGITTALGYSFHLEYGRLACQLAPYVRMRRKFSDFTSPARVAAAWQRRKQLGAVSRFISPGPDLRDGQFHHVALTLERESKTGGTLYVDGKVVLTFDPTKQSGSLANNEPVLIGNHPDRTLHCAFKGMIEDVRLYSRALSGAEIEALARSQ